MQEGLPLMRETLEAGGTLRITVHGSSMRPLLQGGEEVDLCAPPARLRKRDMAFYMRDDGAFVLHRVAAVQKGGKYTMCGDNQVGLEKNIRHDQILAVVTQFQSNGCWVSVQSPAYRAYARRRVQSRPWRAWMGKIYRAYKRMQKKHGEK